MKVVIFLALIATLAVASCYESCKSWRNQPEFDFFVFTQQWPGTVCQQRGWCESTPVDPNAFNHFLIHGLWPNYNNPNEFPCMCSPQVSFNMNKISDLKSELDKYWFTLTDGDDSSFYSHEYEKHGSCSRPVLGDEHDYFNQALVLREAVSLTNLLSSAGVNPSSSNLYSLNEISQAIQKQLNVVPHFDCLGDKLKEVQLCYDRSLNLMDCPSGMSSDCRSDKVTFPLPPSSN